MLKWVYSRIYLILFFTYIVLQLGSWYLDRESPLKVTGPPTVYNAIVGETVKIEVPVVRDITRHCSILISRYMLDSHGTYYDLMATRFTSYEGWVNLEKTNPGLIKFAIDIPASAAPGPAQVITQNSYLCNPLNYIWPIDFDFKVTINVGPSND